MTKLRVYIQSGTVHNYQVPRFFREEGCIVVNDLSLADFVVFTGGSDINPSLYGQVHHLKTFTDSPRDSADIALYHEALSLGLPCIGICRGAQLIHVLNGGGLYQDVDGHRKSHPVTLHGGGWSIKKENPVVTSTHHQMMVLPPVGGDRFKRNPYWLLISASTSTYRDTVFDSNVTKVNTEDNHIDVEALYYPNTQSLCFQGHPEYGSDACDSVALFEECVRRCFKWELKDD